MGKQIETEKIIWFMLVVFNMVAFLTVFEYDTFIETMIWADVLLVAIFKADKAIRTHISLSAVSKKK